MLNQLLNRNSSGLSATMAALHLNEWAPIKNLPKRHQDEILNRSEVVEIPSGEIIFMIKDNDEKDYYLLEGTIELINPQGEQVKLMEHSGTQSLELIDHNKPRIYTAKTKKTCKVFVTRRTFFDTLNSAGMGEQSGVKVEVDEIDMEGSGNWMLHMLNSSFFSSLPPENLQQIFIHMETEKIHAGTVLVEQGKTGEFFYLIQQGSCVVIRQSHLDENKELAQLNAGDSFGERSIISETPSDVSIETVSDSTLMKISKDIFSELIKKPLLDQVSVKQTNSLLEEGASWIDVRNPAQYQQQAIKDSINIDVGNIYTAINALDLDKKYILCGDSGSHAMANAFLLSIKGFSVYSLSVSVTEYLDSNPDVGIKIQQAEKPKIAEPILEAEPIPEEERTQPLVPENEVVKKTEKKPAQVKISPEAISEDVQNLSRDLELQIRKEINDLYIIKQKELENEIDIRFKKYHLVTAKIMKKKLDDLDVVYQVQSKLTDKTRQDQD